MKDISEIVNELNKEGYNILYNLSLELNEKIWNKNPNIHTKEIVMEYPLPVNHNDQGFDFHT